MRLTQFNSHIPNYFLTVTYFLLSIFFLFIILYFLSIFDLVTLWVWWSLIHANNTTAPHCEEARPPEAGIHTRKRNNSNNKMHFS